MSLLLKAVATATWPLGQHKGSSQSLQSSHSQAAMLSSSLFSQMVTVPALHTSGLLWKYVHEKNAIENPMVLAIDPHLGLKFKEAGIPVEHLDLLLDKAGMHKLAEAFTMASGERIPMAILTTVKKESLQIKEEAKAVAKEDEEGAKELEVTKKRKAHDEDTN